MISEKRRVSKSHFRLSGGSPFLGRTRDETFCNITSVNYHFSQTYFANTSQFAKDFISRLFVKDVGARATVDDCLNHPWIRGPDIGASDIRVGATINLSKIHGFKVKMRWRRALEIIRICRVITRRAREEWKAATSMGYTIETKYDDVSLFLLSIEWFNLSITWNMCNWRVLNIQYTWVVHDLSYHLIHSLTASVRSFIRFPTKVLSSKRDTTAPIYCFSIFHFSSNTQKPESFSLSLSPRLIGVFKESIDTISVV